MKIRVEFDIDDAYADPGDSTGLSNAGYEMVVDALCGVGADDINIEGADDE